MDIKNFFCLLVILYLTSGSNSYKIIPNGIAWLGESLILEIEIPNMKRSAVWKSKNYKYECDKICATGDYAVTQSGSISNLTIKNVTWEFSKWSFMDDNLNGAEIELDIKVKPKIEITNETNCLYNVIAECSLPVTDVKCFIGEDVQKFISSKNETCPDGKTFTFNATLEPYSGNLTCKFTMDKIFSEERTEEVECNKSTTESSTVNDKRTESSTVHDKTTASSTGDRSQSIISILTKRNYTSIIIGVLIIVGIMDT